MDLLQKRYNDRLFANSDICEHLQTLRKYASESESVLECGVRGCISSWAFALGLRENSSKVKKLYVNDIEQCNILDLDQVCKDNNIELESYPPLVMGLYGLHHLLLLVQMGKR